MALTADQIRVIRDFVSSAQASNPNNWVDVVTQRMDEVGVSPSMLQQAYPELSVSQIQQAYDASRPQGMFGSNFVGPVSSAPPVAASRPTGIAISPTANTQAQPTNVSPVAMPTSIGGTQTSPAITLTEAARTNIEAPPSTGAVDPGLLNATVQNQPRSGRPTGRIDPDRVTYLENQLRDQYNALNQNAGYEYEGNKNDLDGLFRAQAAKLAANGIGDLSDIGQSSWTRRDGKEIRNLINKQTGEVLYDTVLKSGWDKGDPTAFEFKQTRNAEGKVVDKPVELSARGGYDRWGRDLSVSGQGDYGINFVGDQAVMVPVWKDTKTDTGALAAIAGIGLSLAVPGLGAAIGGTLAPGLSVATQAAIGASALAGVTTGVITGDMDKALIAAALAGGGSYLNATGTLGEVFDTLGLENFKEPLGVLGGQPMSDSAFAADLATTRAAQGASTAAIQQELIAAGFDPTLAASAANMASSGATLSQITSDLKGFEGTAGLFTGGSPSDLAFGGITIGGTGVPTLPSTGGGSGISLGNFAGSETGLLPGTGGETGLLPGTGGETGILPKEVITGAGATGLLNGATGTDVLNSVKDVVNTLGGGTTGSATNLLQGLLGAGIDYATAQQIAKDATALGKEAEATAIAAGQAANVPFTPYTVTSGAGSTAFGVDPITGRPTATVTAAQPYADLRTQALGQAGSALGAINPAAAAESLFQRSEALAAPARQRETEQLLSSLGARGLLGVSRNLPTVGGTTAGVNPYLESLLSSQRTAQAQTALQAQQFGTQEAQRQAALAQGLISTGQGIDTRAMETLTQGKALGETQLGAEQTNALRLLEATLKGQALRQPYENIGLMTQSGMMTGLSDLTKSALNIPLPSGTTATSSNILGGLINKGISEIFKTV